MPAGNTYEAIATQTLGSAAASVTFSSIPGTYTDLVLVISYQISASNQFLQMQFNSDSGSNYSGTNLFGEGTAPASNRDSNLSFLRVGFYGSNQTNSIINIQNYSNTTTNKTVLSRENTDTYVIARVGLWRNTSAITSLVIGTSSGNITSGSTFSLYGIAAA
jgi:hypothetical protein